MSFKVKDNSEYAVVLDGFKNNNFATVTSLTGQVSAGSANVLEVGDKIEWPDEVEFLQNNNMGGSRPVYAIICKVTGEDGAVRYMPWYPTSLGKTIQKLKLDSAKEKVIGREFVRPDGAPAKDYQAKANQKLDDVVRALIADHPNGIKVKGFTDVDTYRFGTKEITTARLYEYEYV